MAEKTAPEKLRLKPGMRAALLNVPAELAGVLALPADVVLVDDPSQADFLLDFATTQAQAEQRLAALQAVVTAETLAWLGYPKGSKAAGLDVSRDTIAGSARQVNLVVVAIVALNEAWSAVRIRPLSVLR